MNYGEIAHIGHGITLALLSIINGCDIEDIFYRIDTISNHHRLIKFSNFQHFHQVFFIIIST